MDEMPIQGVTLATIGRGAMMELFEDELQTVLQNIVDVNREATAKRTLKLQIVFVPSKDRTAAVMDFKASSTLAPREGYQGTVFLGRKGNTPVAIEHAPEQLELPVNIEKVKGA